LWFGQKGHEKLRRKKFPKRRPSEVTKQNDMAGGVDGEIPNVPRQRKSLCHPER